MHFLNPDRNYCKLKFTPKSNDILHAVEFLTKVNEKLKDRTLDTVLSLNICYVGPKKHSSQHSINSFIIALIIHCGLRIVYTPVTICKIQLRYYY
jgi:hypothetical protein